MSDTVTETSSIDSPPGDHSVQLEIFSGPLDLLLHLIRQEEVNIYDIPLARITSQYLRYVDMISNLDLEVAGEFILMAATLIRIKTRLLLPHDESDPDEPDPREELILALVEYKKYKEAGEILRERGRLEERNTIPPPLTHGIEGHVELQPMTSLYDLVLAFRDAMATRPVLDVHEVTAQQVTIEERMLVIINLLRQRESATLVELFADRPTKIVAVTTFVLTRANRLRLHQALPFSEVRVYPGDDIDAPLKDIDLIDYSKQAQQDQQGVAV